jgi:hypothetical protein
MSAIAIREAFEPTSIESALSFCDTLIASRLLPQGVQTSEAAFAILAMGRELGLSAMQSLRSIHVIKGKPAMSADLILALVKRSPSCQFFQLVESSDVRAVYTTQREKEEPTTLEFTIEEAKQAGLLANDNWRKYPKAMLRARCIAALSRAVYPDVALGIYTPDELTDGSDTPIDAPRREPPKQAPREAVRDAEIVPDAPPSEPSQAVTLDEMRAMLGNAPPAEIAAKAKRMTDDDRAAFRAEYVAFSQSQRGA